MALPAMSESGLTQRLADFVVQWRGHVWSASIQETVRNGFVDTAAVMLAAGDEPVTQISRNWVSARASAAQAGLLFGAERASVRDAALVNGVAAHALDYDDVGLQGHPSAVLVPALLAEGELQGASGAALIAAYVVGHEVWAELIERDQDVHHLKGWHPTGLFGTVAATAAVAALRRVDVPTVRQALGISASLASGLIANFGSMTKPFHAGMAAANAIDAVDLAVAGMTASEDVFEHPKGFLHAISPAGRVDRSAPGADFGRTPRIASLGLTVKKYPMCFATHRVIDAALNLVKQHDVLPEQVRSIDVYVGKAQAAMLRNAKPRTGLEAKFSLQFAIAAPLVARACGLQELNDAFVVKPEVQDVFKLVNIHTVDTEHPNEPTLALSDRLCMSLRDGRFLDSGEVFNARGDASSPLNEQDLVTKFVDCTRHIPEAQKKHLLDTLMQLPILENINDIYTSSATTGHNA